MTIDDETRDYYLPLIERFVAEHCEPTDGPTGTPGRTMDEHICLWLDEAGETIIHWWKSRALLEEIGVKIVDSKEGEMVLLRSEYEPDEAELREFRGESD